MNKICKIRYITKNMILLYLLVFIIKYQYFYRQDIEYSQFILINYIWDMMIYQFKIIITSGIFYLA